MPGSLEHLWVVCAPHDCELQWVKMSTQSGQTLEHTSTYTPLIALLCTSQHLKITHNFVIVQCVSSQVMGLWTTSPHVATKLAGWRGRLQGQQFTKILFIAHTNALIRANLKELARCPTQVTARRRVAVSHTGGLELPSVECR